MGFPEMIPSVPCMTDKMTVKSPRQHQYYERGGRAGGVVPATFYCVWRPVGQALTHESHRSGRAPSGRAVDSESA